MKPLEYVAQNILSILILEKNPKLVTYNPYMS